MYTFNKLSEYLGTKQDRPWTAKNLRIVRLNSNQIALRHYQTNILVFNEAGQIQINNGGHYSATTKKFINRHLTGLRIVQRKGNWLFELGGDPGTLVPYRNDAILICERDQSLTIRY